MQRYDFFKKVEKGVRVSRFGFRVPGFGFRVSGFGFRSVKLHCSGLIRWIYFNYRIFNFR